MTRLHLAVRGVVQGVGFRPFVRRVARAQGLTGWVRNERDTVHIEVQGDEPALRGFVALLAHQLPRPARIDALDERTIAETASPDAEFAILTSSTAGTASALLPPDLALCAACREEIDDPLARRYRYPFVNCTACGPRWSIATALPYDRESTTMRGFAMCEACRREYVDPDDRRFHAQPIACPRCGPEIWLVDPTGGAAKRTAQVAGEVLSRREDALRETVSRLEEGAVVALLGVGGYQLLVAARDEAAVARLRERKGRPHEPFAVMFPSPESAATFAELSLAERALLESPEAPIVLLLRRGAEEATGLATLVHGGSPWLGAMLPTTPLHHLLMRELASPVVCTSGNPHGEPMCTRLDEALDRLAGVADVILTHDRPLARPVDDSVARATARGVEVLRRARGYAPDVVARVASHRTALALGAHLKSTVALAHDGQVSLSPHLGDLGTPAAHDLLRRTVDDMCRFHAVRPEIVACDLHRDYASTRLAEELAAGWGAELVPVQHHHAHVAAVVAEHGLQGPVLGLAWDGLGLGDDGTLWGGEALSCDGARYERAARLAPFRLPGGERAVRSPRRSALGLVTDLCPALIPRVARWFSAEELVALSTMLERDLACVRTSSMGRLFDAVAALLEVRHECTFEGQAAMELEALALAGRPGRAQYHLPCEGDSVALAPLVAAIARDLDEGKRREDIALGFHHALVELGADIARAVGIPRVVLSGGCFANRLLADGLHERLAAAGFAVFAGRAVPPGDNAIALGQIHVALSGRGDVPCA